MGTTEFLLAIWALLLTPGPTNTLLALSGAAVGFRRSWRLLPAELAAYLLVTVPLAILGAELLDAAPMLARGVKLAAALWVAWLAVRLWRVAPADAAQGAATPRRVFVTTLLNPKGLIIGLALLPGGAAPQFAPHLLLFAGSILAVAAIWAGGGALLHRDGAAGLPPLFRRAAACWLGILATALAGTVFSA